MRLGLIADVHGNLVALETVLAELARDGADEIVCLGDVAALGPQPAEVIARLCDLRCPCVMGNTDAWLVPDPPLAAAAATTVPVAELSRWCASRLPAAAVAWLRGLPMTIDRPLPGGGRLLCCHASPRSVDDVIDATTPPSELAAMLAGGRAEILAGGHTHVQMMRRFDQSRLLNPGSVGLPGVGPGGPDLPVNDDVSWAEFAVIDAGDGRLSIDLRRVPVDLDRVLAAGRASGMPHLDWWAAKWSVQDGNRPG